MKHWIILIFLVLIGIVFFMVYQPSLHAKKLMDIKTPADVTALFPQSVHDIQTGTEQVLQEMRTEIDQFLSVPARNRNWENTAQAYDSLTSTSNACIWVHIIHIIEMVHPDKAMRDAAHEGIIKLEHFFIDEIMTSMAIYKAWKEYVENPDLKENLTAVQKYFIEETNKNFKRHGLELSEKDREGFKELEKKVTEAALVFAANIAQDNRTVTFTQEELDGVPADSLDTYKRTDEGKYILGIDYPTLTAVLEQCHNRDTRQKLWYASNQRGYPVNKAVLEDIIARRDECAHLLGFESCAAYELDNQMVKTVARAEQFLRDLLKAAQAKATIEFQDLAQSKPASVPMLHDKMYIWDLGYVKDHYKKEHFKLDEKKVAEYFPMEQTIQGLLSIYETFFSLRFEQLPFQASWPADLKFMAVHNRSDDRLLGYFILDLYPRDNKYSHACHSDIIPAVYKGDGSSNVALSVVIANFPKSTPSKPSLLKYHDVNTFFHEFGHALHALLGRTRLASFSGTAVKLDFVEMPSQMLEEWLCDKEILKKVSSHYQTHEPLPEHLIDALINLKTFDSGQFLTRQCFLSLLSLDYYKKGAQKDLDAIFQELFAETCPQIVPVPDNHMYASFGHLPEYGARYYGYMWSKVFALDLFEQIKEEGLLNPVVGHRYAQIILAPGGSQDPNDMLKEFLGREPNQEAFLHDLGLK